MIDTHTHIYSVEFQADIADVLRRAEAAGVRLILLPNVDEESLAPLAELCHRRPDICRPMYGLHPTELKPDYRSQLKQIFDFAEREGNMVAVGEIGLDLYWDKTKVREQTEVFEWQMKYAIDHRLPVSIHCRSAYELLFEVLGRFNPDDIVGALHCFSGTLDDARRAAAQYPRLMFGLNGTFTYKNSTLPAIVAEAITLDRIIIETDAPYLSPVPHRGKRNEPAYLTHVVEKIAQTFDKTTDEISAITDANALRLFGLAQQQDNNTKAR